MMNKLQKNMKIKTKKYLFGFWLLLIILAQNLFAQEFMKPPEGMIVEGVPAIPITIKNQLDRDVRYLGNRFLGWSQKDSSLIGFSNSLFFQKSPIEDPKRIETKIPIPNYFSLQPELEESLIFTRDTEGKGNPQLFQFELETKQLTQLSEMQYIGSFLWAQDGKGIYFTNQNKKNNQSEIYLLDPRTKKYKLITTLNDEYYYLIGLKNNDLIVKSYFDNKSDYFLLNLQTLKLNQFTKRGGYVNDAFYSQINNGIWYLSNQDGESYDLFYYDVDKQDTKKLNKFNLNISQYSISPDEKKIALNVNELGANTIKTFELKRDRIGKELKKPEIPFGVINRISWRNSDELGFDF